MTRVLIVGREGGSHIGGSLVRACDDPAGSLVAGFVDVESASSRSRLWSRISHHVLRNPHPNAAKFNDLLLGRCGEFRPDIVFSVGMCPISTRTLDECRMRGAATAVFLTDDPWNPVFHDPRFLSTLVHYDAVFSPRRANIEQLQDRGCRSVHYLPFGYDADLFHAGSFGEEEIRRHGSEVMFAGGGDPDRLPYISALLEAGIDVGLYGGYWDRFAQTKAVTRGVADLDTLRAAIQGAKVALCLVRRANRDGHVMRTFEVPAVGACMVTEDTSEHREIFGDDGRNVVYFKTIPEMVERCRWLLTRPDEILRLRTAVHRLIVDGGNTYRDRLRQIVRLLSR